MKEILLNRRAGTETKIVIDVAIDRAGYQSKKQQRKTTLQVFFVFFTRPVSPSGIFGTFLLPLMLLTTAAKRKHYSQFYSRSVIRGYSHGIADFTERRNAFTRAQSAKSRLYFARYTRDKNFLSTKLISQKLIRRPHIFFEKLFCYTHKKQGN